MNFSTNPLRLTLKLVRQRRGLFILSCCLWLVIHALPVLTGVLMKGLFDALSGRDTAGFTAWSFLALAMILDVGRISLFIGAIRSWASYWLEATLHLRNSILRYLLTAAGSRRLPDSPSEAVTRFRDDVNDIGEYIENWVDFWGLAAYAVVALTIMAVINPVLTVLACIPLVLTMFLTNSLRPHIRTARRASREATSRVTDFLGETFGSVQAIKASGREASVLRHFTGLNASRRKTALHDTILTELFRSVTDNMVNIATGIILLAGAAALRDGSFTVGDFALFVTYLPRLTGVMSFLGLMVVQHKRTGVAYERLGRLMVDAPIEAL
ncbi:MAG TPA: ABC transporter ATP-binding protein, partial [Trueperaceae bacterium]|nr:ABC transporter ATP-binding protein [Trueperaceae bacterium]